ncbi:helix-turn-helix domain-containing protein [Micromonospora sp. NPDC051296]|uniref:helix-turn-helix domain-containing protein n=1 Tax=Micromonospora sp. NPDC051296 TaxID=3155046 RepID=UPI003440CB1D
MPPSPPDPPPFGPLLTRLRLARGWSQSRLAAELCAAAGVPTLSRHEISRWERQVRRPGRFWRRWLAEVLATPAVLPVEAAFGGRGQPVDAASSGRDQPADAASSGRDQRAGHRRTRPGSTAGSRPAARPPRPSRQPGGGRPRQRGTR